MRACAFYYDRIASLELMCDEELANPSALAKDFLVAGNVSDNWLAHA